MTAIAPTHTSSVGVQQPSGPAPINYAHSITSLITKRQAQLDYLQRVHTSQTLYLNTARFTQPHTTTTAALPPKTTRQRNTHYLLLGLSLGRLTGVTDPSLLLYSLSALLDEFNHFVSHPPHHDTHSYYYHPTTHSNTTQADTIHHTLHVPNYALTQPPQPGSSYPIRLNRSQTLYTYLLIPPSLSTSVGGGVLSYSELLESLLGVVTHCYTELLNLPRTAASYGYLVGVDRRVVSVVIAPLLNDFTSVSLHAMKVAVDGLKESSHSGSSGSGSGSGGVTARADSGEWVKVEGGSGSGSSGSTGGLGGLDMGAIAAMTSVFNAGALGGTAAAAADDSDTASTGDSNLLV